KRILACVGSEAAPSSTSQGIPEKKPEEKVEEKSTEKEATAVSEDSKKEEPTEVQKEPTPSEPQKIEEEKEEKEQAQVQTETTEKPEEKKSAAGAVDTQSRPVQPEMDTENEGPEGQSEVRAIKIKKGIKKLKKK
ncbi:MAG: hypothetical protein QW728_02515, partial [Thermoplasmata archaeon]